MILKAADNHVDHIWIPSNNKHKPNDKQCYIALKFLNRAGFKLKSPLINNELWPKDEEWTNLKLSLEELESQHQLSPGLYPHQLTNKNEAHRIRLHIQHNARCFYKAAKIEAKLDTCKQIKNAIKQRCINYTDDPKKMINSILNRS